MLVGSVGFGHLQLAVSPHPRFPLSKKRLASQAVARATISRMMTVSNICNMGAKPFDFG